MKAKFTGGVLHGQVREIKGPGLWHEIYRCFPAERDVYEMVCYELGKFAYYAFLRTETPAYLERGTR